LAGIRAEGAPVDAGTPVTVELEDLRSIDAALKRRPSAIIHLAAVSSGIEARQDPARCWAINVLGTVRLLQAAERLAPASRILYASTGEVYGAGLSRPAVESDAPLPTSPYAASKAAAEIAVLEAHRRAGLDMVVARPFAQAGPGQRDGFVVPALILRVLEARRHGRREIRVGNLNPTREFLDVRDLASALVILLEEGESGGTYNVAAGRGIPLHRLLQIIASAAGWDGTAIPDAALMRPADIPYLVGDGTRLLTMGWRPQFTLEQTVRDVLEQWASIDGDDAGG
jgi:GDP-4-dehydro-6-deoxy-D-mannose reductase